MDPPYDLAREKSKELLELTSGLLAADGILVFELPADMELPVSHWACVRRIGKTGTNEPSVAILRKADQ